MASGRTRCAKSRPLELEPTQRSRSTRPSIKPDHFPVAGHRVGPGIRWQTFHFRSRLFGLRIEEAGSRVRPRVWACGRPSDELLSAFADEL
jgi:hypothetical protein